jgi:beta-lactamase class A
MLRKVISLLLLMAFVAALLASCAVDFADPLADAEDERTIPTVVLPSVKLNQSVTYPAPEPNEELSTPMDEPLPEPAPIMIPIRSITQNQENVLEFYGDVDMNDPEVAAAVQQINELLAGYDKPIAFCAYSLDGSRAIAYNCRENYFSACTIKAGYMLYCCLAIDQGIVDPDEIMIYEKKYEHGGSGKIKNSEYGTPYTIKELIRLSLRYSDNIAYKMLVHYFGKDGYNKMMNELGVSKLRLSSSTSISSVWNYNANARDLCIIWRELYFYFASETEMAKLFKTATTNTAYNYATKLIDEKYSHKSGDKFKPNPVYNDAAIVWKKDNPYVVATLNGSEGEEEDEYVVGTIVKLINDHIMK